MGRPRKYASHADALRAYREADREGHNAKRREWAAANIEKRRKSAREWARRNKDKTKRTKEDDRERKRRERLKNPDRFRAAEIKSRANRALATGSFSSGEIDVIRKLQRKACAMCRSPLGASYHIDHIIPLARGGSNWSRNLQLLCVSCNLSKGAKDPLVFSRERGLLL